MKVWSQWLVVMVLLLHLRLLLLLNKTLLLGLLLLILLLLLKLLLLLVKLLLLLKLSKLWLLLLWREVKLVLIWVCRRATVCRNAWDHCPAPSSTEWLIHCSLSGSLKRWTLLILLSFKEEEAAKLTKLLVDSYWWNVNSP